MQTLRDITHKRNWKAKQRREGLGTFTGVFLPSFITMIGALLFLNLGTIIASGGVFKVILSLFFALAITMITALSVTSIASNTRIGHGGMYHMLSRCFGYEVGAAAGIALYIAHTLAACLCIMGLSSSLSVFIPGVEIKLLRLTTFLLVVITVVASTKLALKFQVLVFCAIFTSLALFIIGPFTPPELLSSNITLPSDFWTIFSLTYPALIGIEAGAAMSAELRRPRLSLIVGTLTVTLVGFLFYLTITLILWHRVDKTILIGAPNILSYLSPLGPIALVGLFGATLFSAIGCLFTAPKTLSAMAEDNLFPKLLRSNRYATGITALFIGIGILSGSMSGVVPILTKMILVVYGLLNLAVVIEHLIQSPSWRPTVYVWPMMPTLGAVSCIFAMFMMDAGEAFFACGIVALTIFLVRKWKYVSKWNDMKEAILFSISRFAIYKLYDAKHSGRSWRPNFLVLSESASLKTPLLKVANQMAGRQGFLTMASVLKKGNTKFEDLSKWERLIRANLKKRKIDALVEVTLAETLVEGLQNLITNFGMRPLTPNTVVLGESIRDDHYQNYLELIQIASQAKRNVLIIRGDEMQEEIDIWYDAKEKRSCELATILAYSLIKTKTLRNAKITMKCIVKNEKERETKKAYFEQYFDENRLPMSSEIYIEEGTYLAQINKLSTKKGIVFVPMKQPDENLSLYYKTTMKELKDIPTLCLALCQEDIEL